MLIRILGHLLFEEAVKVTETSSALCLFIITMSSSARFPTLSVRDWFGNQYGIWPMSTTGFCGFHCLSQ